MLRKGLPYAQARGGRAFIVDSSQATGTFSTEIQNFIGSDVFPAFHKAGIKYFITILSKSAITNMGIKTYSAKTGPLGIELVTAAGIPEALDWLKKNAR